MAAREILIVDDEVGIRELLSEILFDEGYKVHLAENAAQAREFRSRQEPDLVLLDIWMPDTDGVSLLKEWVAQGLLTMPVVMMSGHGTIETAVEATRIGAVDFLEKPVALQKLLDTVARAVQKGMPHPQQQPDTGQSETGAGAADCSMLSLDLPLREAHDIFDTLYFNHHVRQEGGNMARVAQKAGLERTHLYRKLKQLGIKLAKKEADDDQP
ncbi:MAG: Fis family two component transcriptional regulator [Gallionellaceae bacterium]|nr:MAG: Fis family two component transcriptional regulator [Gallionellaceae bacterium]